MKKTMHIMKEEHNTEINTSIEGTDHAENFHGRCSQTATPSISIPYLTFWGMITTLTESCLAHLK